MPKTTEAVLAFNRGILSKLGLARLDITRYKMAASKMMNWIPRILGSMMLRPGLQYLGTTAGGVAKNIPFVFAADDLALIELSNFGLRVRVSDVLITRPAVTAAVTNGNFTVNLASWTDSDEGAAVSSWVAPGYLQLVGTGSSNAIRDQQVVVTETGTEHALRVVIVRGPVVIRVGSASGKDDYVNETALGTGNHSLAFTPTGNFWIRLQTTYPAARLVDSINVEAAGVMTVVTPWAGANLQKIRWDESADVLFTTMAGQQQQKIERRGIGASFGRSWSVVTYEPEDGPFLAINTGPITIASSGLSGDVTLTASASLFRATHVGALFRLTSVGQVQQAVLSGADQWTGTIRVVGIGNARNFTESAVGGFAGSTLTLQQSIGAPGSWVDVETHVATAFSKSYLDGLDNQIVYYRLGFKPGDYAAGTPTVTLSFAAGSASGVVRITGFTDEQHTSAAVLSPLGGTAGTSDWYEGTWSPKNGWPSAVGLHEGRLWEAGKDRLIGSITDGYSSFDDGIVSDTLPGDSGPIQRTIGEGPIDTIYWLISLLRMCVGTATTAANINAVRIESTAVLAARSSTLDEPLTPTNFNLKLSTARAVFVDRSTTRLYEIAYDIYMNDYRADDLTLLVPDLNAAGIAGIAVQRRPDTRIHAWRNDGTVGFLVFDRGENVICWSEVETLGNVIDVAVLPGTIEDGVYYICSRVINGVTVYYQEKWAQESECIGGTLNKQADAFVLYSGASTTTFPGLAHLEGQSVVGWGDGVDLGTATVTGGSATFTRAAANAVIGLPYEAIWVSMKRGLMAANGSPLNQNQRSAKLGLMLENTHAFGLLSGVSEDTLDPAIPLEDMVDGTNGDEPNEDLVFETYDKSMTAINDVWSTDARLALKAVAPRPCTVVAATLWTDVSG